MGELARALAALDPSTPVPEPVPVCAVPGAVLLPSLLQPHEAEALATAVKGAVARDEGERAVRTAHRRRESQHPTSVRVEAAALGALAARLRPYLPPTKPRLSRSGWG